MGFILSDFFRGREGKKFLLGLFVLKDFFTINLDDIHFLIILREILEC